MKNGKIFIVAVVFLAVSVLFVKTSFAEEPTGWYMSTINQIQTTTLGGKPVVQINITAHNLAFEEKWVQLDQEYVNAGLATALTAVSTGKDVNVRLELVNNNVRVYRMRLIN